MIADWVSGKSLGRKRDLQKNEDNKTFRGYMDSKPFFSRMAHSLDYTIDAKQIKIKLNPKKIEVEVTCGEVECVTTVYQMQKYSRT